MSEHTQEEMDNASMAVTKSENRKYQATKGAPDWERLLNDRVWEVNEKKHIRLIYNRIVEDRAVLLDAHKSFIAAKTAAENDECYPLNEGIHLEAINSAVDEMKQAINKAEKGE